MKILIFILFIAVQVSLACPSVVIPISGYVGSFNGKEFVPARTGTRVIFINQNDQSVISHTDSTGYYELFTSNCSSIQGVVATTPRVYFNTVNLVTDTSMASGIRIDFISIRRQKYATHEGARRP